MSQFLVFLLRFSLALLSCAVGSVANSQTEAAQPTAVVAEPEKTTETTPEIEIKTPVSPSPTNEQAIEPAIEVPKYWNQYDDHTLTGKVGLITPTLDIRLQDLEQSGRSLDFKPNSRSRTFVSLGYRWATISVSTANPTSAESDRNLGTSKAVDFQFRFYFERWSAELFFQQYKGYYLHNSQDVDPAIGDDEPRILYPDMQSQHYGATFYYHLNSDRYHPGGIFDQSVKQKQSGASWLANLSVDGFYLGNSGGFVPSAWKGSFGPFETVEKARVTTFSIGFGGAGILTYRKLFVGAQLMANAGTQLQQFQETNGKSTSWNTYNSQLHGKLGMGFSGEKFLLGASLFTDGTFFPLKGAEAGFNTLQVDLYLGWRFDGVKL